MPDPCGEQPPSLQELMEGVPEALREGVLSFLKAHGLEAPGALAAVAPEDLTQAFDGEPPAFTLGHRASIRRLRASACLRHLHPQPRRSSLLSDLAAHVKPSRWLAPSVVRAWEACQALRLGLPGLCVSFQMIALAGFLGVMFEMLDIWHFLTEWDVRCDHPPLPGNDTGIKYLIASTSQFGARTMSQSLYDAGIEKSYQGVDLALLLWSGLYDDWHRRPENGGQLNHDHVKLRTRSLRLPIVPDIKVLMSLPPAELASAISRCRIEALSFTGAENLLFPVMRVSPNATVLYVHGPRQQFPAMEKYRKWDNEYLNPNFVWSLPLFFLWRGAPHMLPWPALLHLIDPLTGGEIRQRLASGGPPLTQVWGPYIYLWYQGLSFRRAQAHRSAGLRWGSDDSHEHDVLWSQVSKAVPKSRLKRWHLDKNVWPELCELTNVSECKWRGLLRRQKNVPDFKFDKVGPFWQVTAIFVVLLWLDALFLTYAWRLLVWSWGLPVSAPLRRIQSGLCGYFSRTVAGLKWLRKAAMPCAAALYFCYSWAESERVGNPILLLLEL